MRRTLPDVLPWLLVVLASTAALYMMRTNPNLEEAFQWFSPIGHLQVVTAVSVICALLAGVVSVVVLRSSNTRLLWLALAFLTMSGLYAVHGLTTPGIILQREYHAVIGFSGRLAFLACTMFLAGSTIHWQGRIPEAVARRRVAILVLTVAALFGYAGLALWWPEFVPQWFVDSPKPDALKPLGDGASYGDGY